MGTPTLSQIKGRCKVDPRTECWEWANCTQANGYGRLTVQRRVWYAHRYVYQLVHGELPSGRDICHECDNRCCCNPDHLFSGTRLMNMRDCKRKGRMSKGEQHSRATTASARSRRTTKLSIEKAREIRKLASDGIRTQDIANAYDTAISNVRLILCNKAWREPVQRTALTL
jgi:hypothetical protein